MNPDRLAYLAFAAIVLVCVVVAVGFIAIAWLGLTLGLLWVVAAATLVAGTLVLLYRGSGLGQGPRLFALSSRAASFARESATKSVPALRLWPSSISAVSL